VTKVSTFICFDYGIKRIGVAVGQTRTHTATPLGTIHVKKGIPDWGKIAQYIRDWQPDALIVGKPLNMDGTGQRLTGLSNLFSEQLIDRFEKPIYRTDERLSSYEAKLRLKKTNNLDPVAAQVILETWFAENAETCKKNDTI